MESGIKKKKVDERCIRQIEKAIMRAPRNKATGDYEIFVEALSIDSGISRKIIGSLRSKCSELKDVLKDWSTAIVVPSFTNGDPASPESQRPIA